ncbi:sulfite exporter TauE/SafE family protein [Larkinella rosea]|uniref:Sulfite exporter TauE/SafE family protein n=1 Tax=Larkinella rosea TaxID=2025312 RepID=A0A3P1C0R2_9BACT|nr:sulfite exporter TauE/SafE family protein [Larkinella rosea]RRB06990.1 sulfite exporter TauE/SafE family protein [Larkinella rosea]
MNVWYSTALMTGFAGSLHCIGMCGPLVMALPVGRLPKIQRLPAVFLYHSGRLGGYALLGALGGLSGKGLLLAGLQRPVSIGAGLLLLVWVLNRRFFSFLPSFAFARQLTAPLSRLLIRPTLPGFVGAGFFNGLLPCGFVYLALTGALAQSTIPSGAIYMALYGFGTLPALLAIRFFQKLFSPKLRNRFNRLLPVLTVLLALLLIGRGIRSYGLTTATPQPAVPICHGWAP